jgi:hypothetical protein
LIALRGLPISSRTKLAVNTLTRLLTIAASVLLWAAPTPSVAQSLPDDSLAFYLVTVTQSPPTPACQRLVASLQQPAMARIASGCKTFRFTTADPIYRTRYAQSLPASETPTVALVRHDGGVLYKASGANIPPPETLAARLTQMAAADQALHPRANQHGADAYGPLRTPDGQWRVPQRPSLIPDTIEIRPQINVPASASWIAIGGVIVASILAFVFVVLIVGAIFLFTRSP